MSNDFSTWYKSVPQFTRYWLSATVGISLLGKAGVISPLLLFLDTNSVFTKFQVSIIHKDKQCLNQFPLSV